MNILSKHPRTVFWLRMAGWFGIGCVTPVAVFAAKFGLFSVTPTVDALGNPISNAKISINGWGIVACVLIGSYIANIVKEVAEAHKGYSLAKQCYTGVAKTIPLIVAYLICYFLSGVMAQTMYCLAWLIICRLIALPLNPLPKWKFEKQGIEDYDDALKYFTAIVKKKGGDK